MIVTRKMHVKSRAIETSTVMAIKTIAMMHTICKLVFAMNAIVVGFI